MGPRPGMQLIDRSELARGAGFSSEAAFVERSFALVFKQIWIVAKQLANDDGHQVTDEDLICATRSVLMGRNTIENLQ